MFRDCKSGEYQLEGSQANTQRLTNLILLIAIAYTASCLVGLKMRNTGCQEYINRLKLEVGGCFRLESISNRLVEGRNRPRHSYFFPCTPPFST